MIINLIGCGPKAEFVATRATKIDTGKGLEAVAVESAFETNSLHGQQVIYRVGLLNSQQTPIRAPGTSYRDENGNLAASKALIAEEVTGRPVIARVQFPMRSLGLNERHIPVFGQTRLTLPTGEVLAEDIVELPLQYADVGTHVSYPAPTTERTAATPDNRQAGTPPPEFARPRSPTVAARNDQAGATRRTSAVPAPRTATADNASPQVSELMARELIEQEGLVKANPNNVQNQIRLRMLYVGMGRHEDALAYIEGTDEQSHLEIVKNILPFVTAQKQSAGPASEARSAELPNDTPSAPPTNAFASKPVTPPARTAPPSQPSNKRASSNNRPVPPRPERETLSTPRRINKPRKDALTIPVAAICKKINGYGDYQQFPSNQFSEGNIPAMEVYLEVANFESTQVRNGSYRTILALGQKLIDENGVEIWSRDPQDVPDFSETPRKTFFLHVGPIRFQRQLAAGRYQMRFSLVDRTSNESTEAVIPFEVSDG